MRYQFIQGLHGQFPLLALCRAMKVSPSGFWAWQKRKPSRRDKEREVLTHYIKDFFASSRGVYGSPRLWREVLESAELQRLGIRAGKHRVARLMKKAGLKAVAAPKFVVTTNSHHSLPIAENLLHRDFEAEQSNMKWASDITYIPTREGWLYLCVVLDLFSRKVVGWSMSASLERSFVLDALKMALKRRKPGAGLIHHSDRGCQYASFDFQRMLVSENIRRYPVWIVAFGSVILLALLGVADSMKCHAWTHL